MKRVLLTGVSGTGKSPVIGELQARGYKAVDVDGDEYSEWVEVASGSDEYGSTVEPNRDWESVEPRLRGIAGHEIDTSVPMNRVVATILAIAASEP